MACGCEEITRDCHFFQNAQMQLSVIFQDPNSRCLPTSAGSELHLLLMLETLEKVAGLPDVATFCIGEFAIQGYVLAVSSSPAC